MADPAGFTTWIAYILADEGPEVNQSPDEPGGISKYGVSLSAYDDYCHANGLAVPSTTDIANLTVGQATEFYSWFFSPFMLDQMTAAVAYRIADLVVTLGRNGAMEVICETLGIWPIADAMTPAILALINGTDAVVLIWGLSAAWLATKRGKSAAGTVTYGNGWNNRMLDSKSKSLALVS